MIDRLPLFPLQTVVFPQEKLPLHIFEKKYLAMLEECEDTGMTFGIPAFIDNYMEYGTEVQLSRIVRRHSSGAKDVICKGLRAFRIKEILPRGEKENYGGGIVEFLPNVSDGERIQREQLISLISELYFHLELPPPKISAETITSYSLVHKMGLSLQQEYTLLKLTSEKERLSFLINHLCISIPVVQEMNRTRSVIELNGHFKDFNPLDFEDFIIRK